MWLRRLPPEPFPDRQYFFNLAEAVMRVDAKLDRVLRELGEDDEEEDGSDADA